MKYLKITTTTLLLFGVCAFANAQITTTGLSSKQMKKRLENTFLFKNTNIFFPNGAINDLDTLPLMSADNLKEINKELKVFANVLYKIATKEQPVLEHLYGRKLNAPEKLRPEVWNERIALARSEENGVFRLDVQVTQAIFRATVLEGLKARNESILGSPDMPESKNSPDTSEKALLTTFIEEKTQIDHAKIRGMLGDMINSFKSLNNDDVFDNKDDASLDDPSTWFGMSQLAMSSVTTQVRYTTTMLFLFAHEMGHFALGHFSEDTKNDCPKYRQQELDADRYAAYLMIKLFEKKTATKDDAFNDFATEMGENMLGYDNRTLVGDEVFFRDAYVIAKFKNNGVECLYPSPDDRLRQIDEIYTNLTHQN